MSIVAMKNKSRGYNRPISGQKNVGFALNGTLRSQGYVGQDSISHKVIKTPFKGNYPVGHGGHLGKYVVNKISSSYSSSNDPNIIKKSTMNNLGHIFSSLLYPTTKKNCCVFPIVSKQSIKGGGGGGHIVQQTEYIKSLQTDIVACNDNNSSIINKASNNNNNNNNNNTNCKGYFKHLSSFSSGDYMSSIIYKKKCISTNL
jgi:hypothetical protein